jgi:hypothetical protein
VGCEWDKPAEKRLTLLCCWGRLVQNFTILLFYDVSHYDRYHRNQALCKQSKHNLLIVFLYCLVLEAKYVPCSVKNWHSLHFFLLYDELRVSLLRPVTPIWQTIPSHLLQFWQHFLFRVYVYCKTLLGCRKSVRIYNLHIHPRLEIIPSKKKLKILCMTLSVKKCDLQIKGL